MEGPFGSGAQDARISSAGAFGRVREIVLSKRTSREPDHDYLVDFGENRLAAKLLERLVLAGMAVSEYVGGVNYHYADDKCTGCGICAKVCLSGKIRMVDNKPEWQRSALCYMCYACVNFCPREAVQIRDIPAVKSHTTENGRYPHPYATVKDIAAQKQVDG